MVASPEPDMTPRIVAPSIEYKNTVHDKNAPGAHLRDGAVSRVRRSPVAPPRQRSG